MTIQLHSDNYMAVRVYSLMFDLYQVNLYGNLTCFGRIEDAAGTYNKTKYNYTKPLWLIPPRADFHHTDTLYLTLFSYETMHTAPMLSRSALTSVIRVPTTGVVHVIAMATRFTLSLLCDNEMNLYTMTVTGIQCSIHSVASGWKLREKVRHKAHLHVQTLRPNEKGFILPTKRKLPRNWTLAFPWLKRLRFNATTAIKRPEKLLAVAAA
jgi:hypothetical protein